MSYASQGPGWWLASDDKWYPPERHPKYRVLAPSLVGLSIIAFAIGAVMLFSPPHASYAYLPLDSASVQSVATTPCISAWNYWQGNLNIQPNPNQFPDADANVNANAACTRVIHGREHIAVLLVIAAVILVAAALVFHYTRRRTFSN